MYATVLAQVLPLLYHKAVSFVGTVFVCAGLISLIVLLIERIHYHRAAVKFRAEHTRETDIPRRVGVITGASSGLGRRFAQKIDKKREKFQVDELWLIARRRDRLEETAASLAIPTRIIPMDVTNPDDIEAYSQLLRQAHAGGRFSVSFLANCAGAGKYGSSSEIGHEQECRMIELNDNAAITMTDITVQYMHAGARIVQICSVAGFQPIPFFNAYAASKALLYSYSRALRIELMKSGISVTAVCPYWIHDTEFIPNASGEARKPILSTRSGSVAAISLHDTLHRHALSTPGIICTLERLFAGILPDELLAYLMPRFL